METMLGATGLAADQNAEAAIRLLAAQRELYGQAKQLHGWHLLLLGPLPVVLALVVLFVPGWRWFAGLSAMAVLALEASWLAPGQKRLREAAARVQERFDAMVLGLPWNGIACGAPEPLETVAREAARHRVRGHDFGELRDWYGDPRLNALPLVLARLVCQRSNCWWDSAQRRRYARTIGAMLGGLAAGLVVAGAAMGLSAQVLLLAAGVTAPLMVLAYRQWFEQREAADRLDRLRERGEGLWRQALDHPDRHALETESRRLQDEIFDHRKRTPGVFDFIYRRMRAEHEAQMNASVQALVDEALEAMKRRPVLREVLLASPAHSHGVTQT